MPARGPAPGSGGGNERPAGTDAVAIGGGGGGGCRAGGGGRGTDDPVRDGSGGGGTLLEGRARAGGGGGGRFEEERTGAGRGGIGGGLVRAGGGIAPRGGRRRRGVFAFGRPPRVTLARVLLHRLVDEVVDRAFELLRHLLKGVPQDVAALKSTAPTSCSDRKLIRSRLAAS